MHNLYEFLTFQTFVSPYVLPAFYYLGALVTPVGCWMLSTRLIQKYQAVSDAHEAGKSALIQGTRKKDRRLIAGLFFLMFMFMEIIWRMMFEFLIAYLQIREALLGLVPA